MDNNLNLQNAIDADYIMNHVNTMDMGKRVIYYDEVDSTNVVAKCLGREEDTHGTLIIAEHQRLGRGRLGRKWDSPNKSGIWMTLILKPQLRPDHAPMLTLLAALAVNNSIRHITNLDSYIKWPNDIVVNGKKVCGILTEMNTTGEKLDCVVVGIGINANTQFFPEEISKTATSLLIEGDEGINRNQLIAVIMYHFEKLYQRFMQTNNLEAFVKEYNDNLINNNRKVRICEADKEYEGIALGINETGALLVQTKESNQGIIKTTIKTIVAGEVSVRGIYGYV